LPEGNTNFIVWVDPKKEEGTMYYNKVIKTVLSSTVFVQLSDNVELSQWIDLNKAQLSDKSSKVVFISNMTRRESGRLNEEAGLDTVSLIRKEFRKDVPICIYIGDKQKALDKLARRNMQTMRGSL
jgi:hypothetical protein